MTKEQFHEEMEKLTYDDLRYIRRHSRCITNYIPPEVSRVLQFTKLNLLLDDLIDKKKKKGGE